MNSLAPVLHQLQGALAEQAKTAKSWRAGALIVSSRDVKGATTVSVLHSAIEELMTPEQYDAMAQLGLLKNRGEPRKVRIDRGSIRVIDINFDALRAVVRQAEERERRTLKLERECSQLKTQLKHTQHAASGQQALDDVLRSISDAYQAGKFTVSRKLPVFTRAKPTRKQALAGVPTLFLSDWHYGEVVDAEQVAGRNEFNVSIANRRAARVFNTALELLFHHQAGQTYDGLVLAFAGDMLSGLIHEELRRTNEGTVMESVHELTVLLADLVCMAASQFDWVYAPCVPGNHGRLDKKPTVKNSAKENFDWAVYKMLETLVKAKLGSRCNVEFDITGAVDRRFDIYGTRFLLTHGESLSASSDSGDIWPSVMRLAQRKQARDASHSDGFDYMMTGHYHRYGAVGNVIANGSLKGYDELGYQRNYEYQAPIQALFTTHPDYGIIDHRPVYADAPMAVGQAMAQPITTYSRPQMRLAA